MREPWSDRRKHLDDVFAAEIAEPRVQLLPAWDDARQLWARWVVEWSGEGIVLKHRHSVYRPGVRSRAWWKAKYRLVLPVEVLACAPGLIEWGDWGLAAVMAFAYHDQRSGELVTVEGGPRPPRRRVDAASRSCRDRLLGRAAERLAAASGLRRLAFPEPLGLICREAALCHRAFATET
jgi:ATP-dependent DNA ligase